MLQKYEHLLIGTGATRFKTALGLDHPTCAGIKVETYWNNRFTPLPPGIHLLVSEVEGEPRQVKLQQADQADRCFLAAVDDLSHVLLNDGARWGLPTLQPTTTTGLHPDTQIRAYEESYEQNGLRLLFKQGITFFAMNHAQEWVFVRAEPQAVYVTLETNQTRLPRRIVRALEAAHALPTIAPADHAQQLARMQAWWRHGRPLPNLPPTGQLSQLQHLELESKLAVQADFSQSCWQLTTLLQADTIPGFTLYEGDALVRHTYDCVRYLKGKNKLILQGPAYRFAQKANAAVAANSLVLVRAEEKPAYRTIATHALAEEIALQCRRLKPLGDIACHKRKFMVQSLTTGGGYHILIDRCSAPGYPEPALVQIEIECQWKKLPPHGNFTDPIEVAVGEIQQLTEALCQRLPGVQPTQLTKRSWLKQVVNGYTALAA